MDYPLGELLVVGGGRLCAVLIPILMDYPLGGLETVANLLFA